MCVAVKIYVQIDQSTKDKEKKGTHISSVDEPTYSHAEVFSEVETRPVTNNGFFFFHGKKLRSHFDSTIFWRYNINKIQTTSL